MNRSQAEAHVGNLFTVMISISGPNKPAQLSGTWLDVLRLEFDDISHGDAVKNHYQWFDHGQAEEIIDFANQYKCNHFLVHCDAGFSRSIAVGMWLKRFFDEQGFDCCLKTHAIGHNQFANGHVISTLNYAMNKRIYS